MGLIARGRGAGVTLLRMDGPFGALAGSSRKAAHRRTLLRRVASTMLILLAVLVVLVRPGPLRSLARDPAPTTASSHPSGSDTGLLGSAPGVSGTSGAGEGASPGGGGSAYGPGGGVTSSAATGMPGVVALGGLRGASSVPDGTVGMSVPVLDPTMAARLRVGDVVDAYAPGSKSPVARAARVLDIIGVRDLGASPGYAADSTPGAGAGTAPLTAAYVFLAVAPADAPRLAGRRADPSSGGFWLAVRGSAPASARSP